MATLTCVDEPWAEWRELQAELAALPKLGPDHPLCLEWNARREQMYRDAFPRKKKLPDTDAMFEQVPAVKEEFERFQQRASDIANEVGERRKAIKERLNELAQRIPIAPGSDWSEADSVYRGSYSSQTDPMRYARVQAELLAHFLTLHGIETRVTLGEVSYVVEAKASIETIEVCKLRSARFGLREQVAFYWSRGVNPRVYLPMLPHGFEEQNGINYFGR